MAEIAVKMAISKGEGLIGKVVGKAYDSISGELSLLLGVREEIQDIIDELEIMSAFIREAEEKQATDASAKAWVKQVRQLAYSVEDCIDEFSLHLEHRSGRQNYVVEALSRRTRSLGSLRARHRIAAEIQSIKIRVEKVSNRRLRYDITKVSKESSGDNYSIAQYDPRLAALFVEDSQLVGIDGPRDQLVRWLDENGLQRRLITVVGEGGLGKTTIVKKAYESSDVILGGFMYRAWITVSQVYHIDGLLRDMIRQVFSPPPDDLDKMGTTKLIANLMEHLKDKRYLIVFDDVWKMDAWNNLLPALPENNLKSRIILTTRNNEIAEACLSKIPGHIYQHQKLSSDKSKELFCRRVFGNAEHTCPQDLKEVSEDIMKKCDGLPLAIISIAGVLFRKDKKEWKNMLTRLGSELEYNKNLEGMKQILIFSYDDLPYHVKRCFLYLSKYPEDYLIERRNIQRLWVAEGLVEGRRDMTAEEVAESNFNELINRFIILPSTFSANGKVKRFRVHDIMLEVIVSKSMEETFVSLLGKNSSWIPRDVIRRLSVHGSRNLKNMSLSHVRSLFVFGDAMEMLNSPSLGMLRVLDLEGCYALRNHHLKIVVKLLHLKYLSVKETEVSKLPNSLGNLRNLETLDVRKTKIAKIPARVIKLQQLRFLLGGWQLRFLLGGWGRQRWQWCLMNFPRGIGKLRALQELVGVNIEDSSKDVVKELGKLTQLRKLTVSYLPEKSGKNFGNSLEVMSGSLRSLHVYYSSNLTFMNNLSSPPLLLESLTLEGELGTLPSWVRSLTNLVKISLCESKLQDDDGIRALGTLPNLIQLSMSHDAFEGDNLCFDAEEFPNLKVLHLVELDLRSLSFGGGALPHLKVLHLFPSKMGRISISGIKNLPNLKEIFIIRMHRDDLDAVKTQVEEHPNHPGLIASDIS